MSLLDRVRSTAFGVVNKVPGVVGDKLRGVNEALGRPLAGEAELADRRAFAAHTGAGGGATAAAPAAAPAASRKDVAPVIVYCMDKTRRDATKLTDMLDAEKVPYQVSNIQEDPAAQMAVRRDSKGFRLPVVFIAGDAVGGRAELANLISTGQLAKKVFG